MRIRSLRPADIRPLMKIIRQNFSGGSIKRAAREMRLGFQKVLFRPRFYVAEAQGKVVGVAGFNQSWMDYAVYEVFWVNVDPEYQNRGVGTALLQKITTVIRKKKGLDRAKMILLSSHIPGFYERLGFENLGGYGHPDFLMGYKIPQASSLKK